MTMPETLDGQRRGAVRHAADDGQTASQFVTFEVNREIFAVPLAEVQEIIRLPDLVAVPLGPPSLDGLANLRGSVLPVASLRRIFGQDEADHDDGTRVVVINQGIPLGFKVDRMARVISAEPRDIESAGSVQASVASDLLAGLIKHTAGMIMVLDPARLIAREFHGVNTGGRSRGATALAATDATASAGAAQAAEVQLVSFTVAGQEYALPIEHVQEIVQVPDRIGHVPNAPPHVCGVITLRQRLLPLIGLRAILGLGRTTTGEFNRIVVVNPPRPASGDGEGGTPAAGASIGLVVDSVKEVLRVGRSLIDPVPAQLAATDGSAILDGICRLQDGRRLVTILSILDMFRSTDRLGQGTAATGDAMTLTTGQSGAVVESIDEDEQFVVFRLAQEEYGVPIARVQEIVRVPDLLVHVPKAPPFVEGVMNLRGAVLPVVDQRRRFGLGQVARHDRQRIMVFTFDGVSTGFIVDGVTEVLKVPCGSIGPAPTLSPEQARLIHRVANLESRKRIILLLDVDQLLTSGERSTLATVA